VTSKVLSVCLESFPLQNRNRLTSSGRSRRYSEVYGRWDYRGASKSFLNGKALKLMRRNGIIAKSKPSLLNQRMMKKQR